MILFEAVHCQVNASILLSFIFFQSKFSIMFFSLPVWVIKRQNSETFHSKISLFFSSIFSVTKQVKVEQIYIPAESHGDGAGGDFGDARGEDDRGRGIGAGQASSEGEGNGKPVGYADDDVTDDLTCSEVLLFVLVKKPLLLGV